ncbi:hypothetical protein [Candidatus Frankia alpina]|nr:hypothetical protein [Candidatus Frankia alpina]
MAVRATVAGAIVLVVARPAASKAVSALRSPPPPVTATGCPAAS